MLRASRDEALTDAADRPRQPPRADAATSSAALAHATDEAPARARPVRPRRLQALQRHLRPPGRRRAARPPRRQPAPAASTPRARLPHGRRRVLRAHRAARGRPRGRDPRQHGQGGALRARRGLHHRRVLRRDHAPGRGGRRHARPCGSPTSAMYAQKHGRPDVGQPPEQGRAPARARRAPSRPRRPTATASPTSRRPPRAGSGCPRRRSTTSATPPSCTTSARSRSPTRSSTSPGRSDPDEWAFIRRHTVIGERIIAAAPALEPVAELVRSSHERWDGGGYPDGLAAEAIPLGARIVAVADAFDAMTADRAYRTARGAGRGARRAAPLRRDAVRPRGRDGVLRRLASAAPAARRRPEPLRASPAEAGPLLGSGEDGRRDADAEAHARCTSVTSPRGARLVPFAGWEMPVQYARHPRGARRAVRERAGRVRRLAHGPDRDHRPRRRGAPAARCSPTTSPDRRRAARSTRCCAGGRRRARRPLHLPPGPERFLTVTNAANHARDLAWLREHAEGFDAEVADRIDDFAMLAVQGPAARGAARAAHRRRAARRASRTATLTRGRRARPLVCGTGYTGEDGVELLVAPEHARAVWDAVSAAGAQPVGLGARDTLRLEACFHLYGNDLDGGPRADRGRPGLVLQGGHRLHRRRGGRAPCARPGRRRSSSRSRSPAPASPRQGNPVAGGGVVTSGTLSPVPGGRHRHGLPPGRAGRARHGARDRRARQDARRRGPHEAALPEGDLKRGRGELPRRPQVPPRARLGAGRRRHRDVRHHLVRAGRSSARSSSSTRPRSAPRSPRTSPTPRSSPSRPSPT